MKSRRQVEMDVYDIYCNEGVASACDEANKHTFVVYEYCNMCCNSMPTIKGDHGCLICGHETTRDPEIEEIPLENYTDDEY